jgi:hypothetical protein
LLHVHKDIASSADPVETIDELEGLGSSGAPSLSPGIPPNGNGRGKHRTGVTIQRQEEAASKEPTEAERAAALAAAKAAMAKAQQSASQGRQEIALSKNKKEAEKQAGTFAKQKADQAKGEAAASKAMTATIPEVKPPGAEGVKGEAPKKPGAPEKSKLIGNGVKPPSEASARAPTSPEADPAFQQVVKNVKGVAGEKKMHAAGAAKAGEAQAAAESPAGEVEAKAQSWQVGEMQQAETPGFNAAAFKAQLMQRIEEIAPKTAEEADNFKDENKLSSVKDEASTKAAEEGKTSKTPMEEATAKPPDTSAVEPKTVTPMKPEEAGAPPEDVGAEAATPKPKGTSEVEQPLKENTAKVDQQMAEADVTEDQLAKSNEPEFQGALDAKKEAQTQAETGPSEYRAYEQTQISSAEGQAAAVAAEKTQAMQSDRASLLGQVGDRKAQTKSKDETERAKVAAEINKIYDETKTKVENILNALDGKVSQAFDEGAAAAKKAFEDYVDARMEAFKEERYGGFFGWAQWLEDKLLGMPPEVNVFYAEGRQLFLSKMDAVIDNVVAIVGTSLTEAKAEIANGKKRIQTYVDGLPADLKKVGQEAAAEMDGKFQELEQRVESKQNELIDSLAQKYQENLQAIDARIEELKAANQGLVDKAINAVVGVIKIILKLKEMITTVLAKVASVVGKIIEDPIGFLGNLVKGIKLGFDMFVSNIMTHLQAGLVAWLTGSLGPMGIQIPDDLFSLEGIFSLVMQVLGLSWEFIRSKAVKLLGEPVVKVLETGFELFQILINQGPAGLWEYVKEQFTDLKEMVIDAIKDMVITEVIKAGVKWILGLLNPVGAFIKACMAIYDIVMFFIERGSQIMELVNAVVDGVAAIANGAVEGAAKLVENALAKAVPVVIGLLASLLGISGLAKKVQGIIMKIRARIDKAIDSVILKAKKLAGKVMSKLGFGKVKKEEFGPDHRTEAEKQADVDRAISTSEGLLEDPNATPQSVETQLPAIKTQYRLSLLNLVEEADGEYHIEAQGSAQGKTKSQRIKSGISIYVKDPKTMELKDDIVIRDKFYKKNYTTFDTVVNNASVGHGWYRCQNRRISGVPNHQPRIRLDEVTIEHTDPVVDNWNSDGHDWKQDKRNNWYDDPSHLKVFCESCNKSRKAEDRGKTYTRTVTKNFRGPNDVP